MLKKIFARIGSDDKTGIFSATANTGVLPFCSGIGEAIAKLQGFICLAGISICDIPASESESSSATAKNCWFDDMKTSVASSEGMRNGENCLIFSIEDPFWEV